MILHSRSSHDADREEILQPLLKKIAKVKGAMNHVEEPYICK